MILHPVNMQFSIVFYFALKVHRCNVMLAQSDSYNNAWNICDRLVTLKGVVQ